MDVINETCQYIKSIIDYDALISTEINGVRAYDKQLRAVGLVENKNRKW